ncbi:MAG: hypothetical protein AAF681_14590 [Pseudomonadota bacterium]
MLLGPKPDQPPRKRQTTRDTTDAALFRVLLVIAALGIWLIASSAGSILGEAYEQPVQTPTPQSPDKTSEPSSD